MRALGNGSADHGPVSASDEKSVNDLHFAVRLTALALLIEFALAWRVFVPGWHLLGAAPLIETLANLPDGVSITALVLAIASAAWLLLAPARRLPAACFLLCEVFWCLRDIHLLQPWMIMYSFVLLAIVCAPARNKTAAVNAIRIMVCGVYFWAGFHKLNLTFYARLFPWFIEPLHHFPVSPGWLDWTLAPFIIATPVFESAIGILLLFPRGRRIATLMAFLMLVVVLACLGPLGHNWGAPVWPWNVYLFALEMRLFFTSADPARPILSLRTVPESFVERLSFVLFAILPVLAIFMAWYALPGFKLYSGNIVMADIILAPDETLARVPARLGRKLAADRTLNMLEWFTSEQMNGIYPAPYALLKGAQGLCPYLDNPNGTILRVYDPPPFYSLRKRHDDLPLCH